MKKILIITGMILFFGMPSLAFASQLADDPENDPVLELLKQQLHYTHLQFYEIEKIHNSLTGPRIRNSAIKNDDDLLLTEPKYIYDESKETEIDPKFPQLVADIKRQEEYSANSTHEIRTLIDLRSQYASIIDKVVSLQVLEETEKRFSQVAQYLMALRDTQDLKAIIEVQTFVKGMHAMIQNEATKLQMVAHLRNAEQALIRQQKYKRNMKILNHTNRNMPAVKYVSATP